ncbi:MAG: pitrilysin family protein [Clostridia bacterium]
MENNISVIENEILKEKVYKTKLDNGLDIYICKKDGFTKKIGMFGTKYGSLNNDFVNIEDGKRITVPDGIAHFLEHKLFEQEGENALDLFSKEGISANAYTSFDHTVYFFETISKFKTGLEMLIKLVKTPYFTTENVNKEQGIIGQEISMYDDDPNFMVYFNTLRAMYINNPVRIDIAGTIESISHIDKDVLYTCYNTFYNPNNMFMVIIGDVDVQNTINIIKQNLSLYEKETKKKEIIKYYPDEPSNILEKKIEKNMGIYMPQISIGYKLDLVEKNEIIKREVISEIISEMYFSKSSSFYEKEYNNSLVNDDIDFIYEGTKTISHILISTSSSNPQKIMEDITEYINNIKNEKINLKLFNNIKRKKIGENILMSEDLNNSYRRIIDSILNANTLYYDIEILNNITENDITDFLNLLTDESKVYSVVK